jgi:hypothetical protein
LIIRFFELAIGVEMGFALFSFLWEDGSYHSLLSVLHDRHFNCTYVGFFFIGYLIEWGYDGEEDS